MTRQPSLPVAPWDMPAPTAAIPPVPADAPDQKEALRHLVRTPPAKMSSLLADAFREQAKGGRDTYMARALLQLADENHELRARVDALEAAVFGKGRDQP